MNRLFQRILCPVDFDDQFGPALDLAARVAQQSGGRVFVLHVMPVDAETKQGWETGVTVQLERRVSERLKGKADYEFIVRTGPPAIEVLKAARELESDLIVIPTHGRAGIKRLLLGSVAERVIREASVPVLTLRAS